MSESSSLHGLSERGVSARSDAYNGAARASLMKNVPERIRLGVISTLKEMDERRDRTRAAFERDRDGLVKQAYLDLMSHRRRQGIAYRPRGAASQASDPFRDLAARIIEERHAQNLVRIDVEEARRVREQLRPSRQFGWVASAGYKLKGTSRTSAFNHATRADVLKRLPPSLRPDAMKIIIRSHEERQKLRQVHDRNREPLIEQLHKKIQVANDAKAAAIEPAAAFVEADVQLRDRASRIVDRQHSERLETVTRSEAAQLKGLMSMSVDFSRASSGLEFSR